jgi:hypothetical protein
MSLTSQRPKFQPRVADLISIKKAARQVKRNGDKKIIPKQDEELGPA